LYAVSTVPSGNDAVLIVGATPPPLPLPSPQAAKENPITATMAITPNLILSFIQSSLNFI
jgi:hypothetical protein